MKVEYKIYTLCESQNTLNIRYVGATVLSPQKRLRMHLKDSKRIDKKTKTPRDQSYKAKWIRKCLRENKTIVMNVIDSLPYYDEKLEIKWIKKYRNMGYKLTNTSDGGKSFMLGKHHSRKTKKRLRDARLGVKVSEETANKTRGGNNGFATTILQYSKSNEFIKEYSCISDAYKELGADPSRCRNITLCASKNKLKMYKKQGSLGRLYSSMGFIWKYKKDA